ncbi:uncharacterized protein [Amphiura filiformis]|uniref:uncharacterized protein n=1 Tax=Amphiura filiformis TaxID=82378 RepID=UPI003B22890B
MAQTTQRRSGGTNASESPMSPEQKFEEDTRKAIALSLESAKFEEHSRTRRPSPNTSGLSTPTDGTRAKTPTDITLSGQSTSGNLNNQDPFSVDQQKNTQLALSSLDQDLMQFSFDHVLKNYNRQKTSQPQKPQTQSTSQYTLPFPLPSKQNKALPVSRTATLPAHGNTRIPVTNTNFGVQRTGLTHQQSFPVQTSSNIRNPFGSNLSTSSASTTNPFATSWKPDSKYLTDLSQSSLPQQSRSSPPSPTSQSLTDFDSFC